jgi:hemoglobin-like flavoprotein
MGGRTRQAAGAELLGGRYRHTGRCRARDAAGRRSGLRRFGHLQERDPEARAKAIVKAATYYKDPEKLLEASEDLGMAMPGLFIRAPIIRKVGPEVKVLAEYLGTPVLAEQGKHMVATFHPELTHHNSTVHRHFIEKI